MDIKIVETRNNKSLFEEKIKKLIEEGYEIKASNSIINQEIHITKYMKRKYLTTNTYYYGLLEKK